MIIRQESLFSPLNWRAILQKKYGECVTFIPEVPLGAQANGDAMDSNFGKPERMYDICLKFCLKMFVMLHIPEALRQTVMPRTPTWVNQEKISTFV